VRVALAVYEGPDLPGLRTVVSATPTSLALSAPVTIARFDARAGRTYHLAMDSLSTPPCTVDLVLNARLSPAWLRLGMLGQEVDGRLRLNIASSYPRPVQLEVSSDLIDWAPLQALPLTNEVTLLVPPAPAPRRGQFYRVLTWE
jgi:hypothetical protein